MGEYPSKPEVAVGALIIKDEKVLLVKRKRPPAKDFWAVPGGKIHLGETLQQAAEREIFEETGISIIPGEPIFTFDAIERDGNGKVQFHYVIVDIFAEYKKGKPKAGDDATDVGWFSREDMEKLSVNPKTKDLALRYLKSKS